MAASAVRFAPGTFPGHIGSPVRRGSSHPAVRRAKIVAALGLRETLDGALEHLTADRQADLGELAGGLHGGGHQLGAASAGGLRRAAGRAPTGAARGSAGALAERTARGPAGSSGPPRASPPLPAAWPPSASRRRRSQPPACAWRGGLAFVAVAGLARRRLGPRRAPLAPAAHARPGGSLGSAPSTLSRRSWPSPSWLPYSRPSPSPSTRSWSSHVASADLDSARKGR